MDYIEIKCTLVKNSSISHLPETVSFMLSNLGFDCSEEANGIIKGYARKEDIDDEKMSKISGLVNEKPHLITTADTRWISEDERRKIWEAGYHIVDIAGRIAVYAPFHTNVPDREYRICIVPNRAFGTGRHDTTAMMLDMMLNIDMSGKNVLDMGCGTGILSIFAAKKNARSITAIDIEELACADAIENCKVNNIHNVEILHGDSSMLAGRNFDVVLANLTDDILLAEMNIYASCLPIGGILQISGFCFVNYENILDVAKMNNLRSIKSLCKNNWIAITFHKQIKN
jgi:ribosomal protein L11 methyltransferase